MWEIIPIRELAVPFWEVSPMLYIVHSCVEVHLVDMEYLLLQTCKLVTGFSPNVIDSQK